MRTENGDGWTRRWPGNCVLDRRRCFPRSRNFHRARVTVEQHARSRDNEDSSLERAGYVAIAPDKTRRAPIFHLRSRATALYAGTSVPIETSGFNFPTSQSTLYSNIRRSSSNVNIGQLWTVLARTRRYVYTRHRSRSCNCVRTIRKVRPRGPLRRLSR